MSRLDNRAYYDDFAKRYERERHHGYHALLDELELDIALPLAAGRDIALEQDLHAGLFDDGAKLARLAEFYADCLMESGLEFDMIFGPATGRPKSAVFRTADAFARPPAL